VRALLRFLGLGNGSGSHYAPPSHAPTIIGAGMNIKGEIKGEGAVVMLGAFEGEVALEGTLHVGPDARVDANITATAIVIAGTVRGNLSANTRVEILASGSLTGSVRSGSFTAADGAIVKGDLWVEPPAAASLSHAHPSEAQAS
jgi:cytoskeletal protein CcmA (bactofilin family)